MSEGLPIADMQHPDVAVMGGGMSGVAAAVAASRQGASVLLVESYGFLGGLACSAMVGTICGLYYRQESGVRWAAEGYARAFAEQLRSRDSSEPMIYKEGLCFLPYDVAVLNHVLQETVAGENITCILHASLREASYSDEEQWKLRVVTTGRTLNVRPGSVVDATGDALVSRLSGFPLVERDHYQAGALVFGLAGLPDLDSQALILTIIKELKRGVHDGSLDPGCARLSLVPGSMKGEGAMFKLGIAQPYRDDPVFRSQYEIHARDLMYKIVEYLKSSIPQLKGVHISCVATQVGIRSGALPHGVARLEVDDVLACRKHADGIAKGAWPIEYWGGNPKPEMTFFPEGRHYDIPAGALQSSSSDRLFFAGRNIAGDEKALGSARVIGTCMQTGYAAGVMAACRSLDQPMSDAVASIRQAQMNETE